jgi:ubiquinone biosynthesis protein UbiJ
MAIERVTVEKSVSLQMLRNEMDNFRQLELADAYEAIAALYEETEALKARIAVLEGGKV